MIRRFERPASPYESGVSGICPNCHQGTSLTLSTHDIVWPGRTTGSGGESVAEHVVFERWGCNYCKKGTCFLLRYAPGAKDRPPSEVIQVWPRREPRQLPDEAPAEVRSLYEEASRAEAAGALRGAAALYRAAVEELCKAQGCTSGKLEQKINDLATKGVDQGVVDDLHEARFLGNWSIHEGLVFEPDEVADVASLIDEAITVLYVQPAERQRLREARRARRERR